MAGKFGFLLVDLLSMLLPPLAKSIARLVICAMHNASKKRVTKINTFVLSMDICYELHIHNDGPYCSHDCLNFSFQTFQLVIGIEAFFGH